MASLKFPDTGSRYVFLPSGRPAINGRAYVYADAEHTVPAEIYRDVNGAKGAQVPLDDDGRVSIRLDNNGGQLDYWGPVSGQDRLFLVVNGVPSVSDADYNARIDTVEQAVATLAPSTGLAAEVTARIAGDAATVSTAADDATTKAGNAQTAAAADAADKVAAHAADTTGVHGIADTSLLETTAGAQDKATAAQAAAVGSSVQKSANLSDLASASTARTNLGLGTSATRNVGTTSGDVAAGDAPAAAQAAAIAAAASDATSKVAAEATARSSADALLTPQTRTITAGTGLTGGGTLSADRTLSVAYGTTSTTAARGDDTRLSDARTPTSHAASHASGGSDPVTVAQSQVTGLSTALGAKADLVGGLVPTSQIPPSSATYRGEVASEAAMLALPAVKGDYARRTDTTPNTFWTLIGTDATVIGSWLQTSSAGAVSSVNSQSGNVVLGPADVGAVPVGRTVTTTSPLTGGGALSANLTFGVTTGTTAGTVAAGDAPAAAQAAAISAAASDATTKAGAAQAAAISAAATDATSKANAAQAAAIAASAQRAANLSDLSNPATARTNLGVPPSTRTIAAGTGLSGGGDLSADRTFAVTYGTTSTSATRGDDSRLFAPGILVSQQSGGTDLAKLQAAVTAAATLGSWALIDSALTVSGTVAVPSGARIDGTRGTVTQTAGLTSLFTANNVSRVVIQRVRATGVASDYVNSSSALAAAAIYVAGTSSNVVIEDCDLTGFAGAGVRMSDTCSDVHVRKCRIQGPGSAYITASSSNYGACVVAGDGTQRWSVRDCELWDHAQGVNSGDGDDAHVTGNWIHDIVGQHGLYLDAISNLVVSQNIIKSTVLQGIKIQIANSTTGPDADKITVTGNVVDDSGSHGILFAKVVSGSRQFRRVTVTGNTVSTTGAGGDGINLNAVTDGTFTGNVVYNARYGLNMTDCSRLSFAKNRFSTVQKNGIMVLGASTDIDLDGNRVYDPASDNDATARYGILIGGSASQVRLTNNVVSDSASKMQYGLYLTTSSQATCTVRGNDLSGATDYGARLDNTQSVREWGNNRSVGTLGTILNFPSTLARRASVHGGPAMNGHLGSTFDPGLANAGVGVTTAGVLLVAKVLMDQTGPITSVDFLVTGAGATLTTGQNFIAVYDAGGTLIGTSVDQTTNFGGTGQKNATMQTATAVQEAGAYVFVAMLWNGTTSPQLRGMATTAGFVNVGLTSATYRFATAGSGLTTPPGTLPTLASGTQPAWFGLK